MEMVTGNLGVTSGHLLREFQLAAVLEVGGDAGRPKAALFSAGTMI